MNVNDIPDLLQSFDDPKLGGLAFSNTFYVRLGSKDAALAAVKRLSETKGKDMYSTADCGTI